MVDVGVAPELPKPLTIVVAITTIAVVVGVAYRLDRTYARWLTRMSPLTEPRERAVRLRDGYRVRRATASEFAHLINDFMDEVARARRDSG
jgi:hypothetical protein